MTLSQSLNMALDVQSQRVQIKVDSQPSWGYALKCSSLEQLHTTFTNCFGLILLRCAYSLLESSVHTSVNHMLKRLLEMSFQLQQIGVNWCPLSSILTSQ